VSEPPPGYLDMLADGEAGLYSDDYADLNVDGVGAVSVRRPRPNAIPLLAMAVNPDCLSPDCDHRGDCVEAQQFDYSTRFIQAHLADGEWERLNTAMMDDELPADAIPLTARAVATWGTSRPYTAVVGLALQTAHIWRTVRLQLVRAGHENPMRLPHMHIVLDETEDLVVSSMVGADGQERRDKFYTDLYAPPPEVRQVRDSKGRRKIITAPPGFSPVEQQQGWNAWRSAQSAAG